MANVSPFLFILLALVGAAELGLVAYLISVYNRDGYPDGRGGYTSNDFKHRIRYLLFVAVWTTLFGLGYLFFILMGSFFFLASIASSALWLLMTIIFWAVGAELFRQVRVGGGCDGTAFISECRQLQTVEALAWTALGLSAVTLISAMFAIRRTRPKHGYRARYYDDGYY